MTNNEEPEKITAWFNDDGTFSASPHEAPGMFKLRNKCEYYYRADIAKPDNTAALEAVDALDDIRKEFYEMANESEANDLYLVDFDGKFKTIRAFITKGQGVSHQDIASLSGALAWCIGKLEGMGANVVYPEKVLKRYTEQKIIRSK